MSALKKFFFGKSAMNKRIATAGERKTREISLLDVDRRFGVGPTEERILACASAQLQMEILDLFWS